MKQNFENFCVIFQATPDFCDLSDSQRGFGELRKEMIHRRVAPL